MLDWVKTGSLSFANNMMRSEDKIWRFSCTVVVNEFMTESECRLSSGDGVVFECVLVGC